MKGKIYVKVVLMLLCLVLLTTAAIAVIQKVILDVPGSIIINGKNISAIGITGTKVNVDVDGVKASIEDKEERNVNGVLVEVLGFSRAPPKAILNLTVNINCGDGTCSTGEDPSICCADCGCLGTKLMCMANRCVENITQQGAQHKCFVDTDCNDNDPCTIDVCDTSAYPNKCATQQETACVAGDSCCPENCDTPEDADCATRDKCTSDSDCDDNDACTTNTCSGTPKRCASDREEGCSLNENCVPEGTINQGSYCLAAAGTWEQQKADTVACKEDYECLTLLCSGKTCGQQKSPLLPRIVLAVAGILVLTIIVYFVIAIKK